MGYDSPMQISHRTDLSTMPRRSTTGVRLLHNLPLRFFWRPPIVLLSHQQQYTQTSQKFVPLRIIFPAGAASFIPRVARKGRNRHGVLRKHWEAIFIFCEYSRAGCWWLLEGSDDAKKEILRMLNHRIESDQSLRESWDLLRSHRKLDLFLHFSAYYSSRRLVSALQKPAKA